MCYDRRQLHVLVNFLAFQETCLHLILFKLKVNVVIPRSLRDTRAIVFKTMRLYKYTVCIH